MPRGYRSYVTPGSNAALRWEQGVARSGTRSLYIANRGPHTGAWLAGSFPVIPGMRYRCGAFVRMSEAEGKTCVSVRILDDTGKFIRLVPGRPLSGTHDWSRIWVEFTAPPNSASFYLVLGNSGGERGEVWFDDLWVEDDLELIIKGGLRNLRKALSDYKETREAFSIVPNPLNHAEERKLIARTAGFQKLVETTDFNPRLSTERRRKIFTDWFPLSRYLDLLRRYHCLVAIYTKAQKVYSQNLPFIVGWESPMRRVFLKDLPVEVLVSRSHQISLFKGEVGAVQIVLIPLKRRLQEVTVFASDLVSGQGRIAANAIEVHPVGFVRIDSPATRDPYPTEHEYRGWWPDPLLENFPFEVEAGASQPVWIAIRVPRKASPGIYRSRISIKPANTDAVEVELVVKVWDYLFPHSWHFANVLSFYEQFAHQLYGAHWTTGLKRKFLEFLLERRINLTSIYGGQPFSEEELRNAAKAGQNTFIVTTLAGTNASEHPYFTPSQQKQAEEVLDRWTPFFARLGVSNRSWAYGFDERPLKAVQDIQTASKWLKDKYQIKLLTTVRDDSYGMRTGISGTVGAFCPYVDEYDSEQAAATRARGSQVWWYITDWSIEQPAIRSRLFGWMTFKAKADGFLHWVLNRWVNNQGPLSRRILQEAWNPRLDGVHPSSSGMLVYPGEDGPLSSIRLENFRQGIQDYDLLKEAERLLSQLETSGKKNSATSRSLRRVVSIGDDFIHDPLDYSSDPKVVEEHREALAAALLAAKRDLATP